MQNVFRQLIRTDDYLSPEEMEKYEEQQEAQRQTDLEEAQQALEAEQIDRGSARGQGNIRNRRRS